MRKTFDGFTWELELPSNVDQAIAEGRWWEPIVHDWICAYVKPGMICVDAGAHIGVFALLMARCGSWVHAFEPCPSFYQRLRGHVKLNGIENASTNPVALGDHEGPVLCRPSGSSSRVGIDCKSSTSVAVEMIKLDTYFLARKRPGFLKIDVDGSELVLLAGAKRTIEQSKPVIVIDIPAGEDSIEIAGWLTDRGYTLSDEHDNRIHLSDLPGEKRNILALPDGPGSWNEEM